MASFDRFEKVGVQLMDGHVAIVELRDPPHNFFSLDLVGEAADALLALDEEPLCRSIVIAASGKSFSAGADFGAGGVRGSTRYKGHLYDQAVRLFESKKPVVAAVHGPAIGGGLGLALSADFRVTCPEARFSANFCRMGFFPGFGLTHTLPALIGQQAAYDLFYTGRRVKGDEAVELGLADRLVPLEEVRSAAIEYAREIATSGPLGVQALRLRLRGELAEKVRAATQLEQKEQDRLLQTEDAREGIRAYSERRTPVFKGK